MRNVHLLLASLLLSAAAQAAEPQTIDVYRDPNCGCCGAWVKHLEANGFSVNEHIEADMSAVKTRLGVPPRLASCHTGVLNGQFIEGHVPASDIQRLLQEHPKALGLAVPRMPVGAPGMDGPAYGGRQDPFDVLLVALDGTATVYQRHA